MAGWQPIDYHGIVTLNKSVIADLSLYLEQKETQVAEQILHAICPLEGDLRPPVAELTGPAAMTLAQGADALERSVNHGAEKAGPKLQGRDLRPAVDQVNQGLWEYVELLEGMAGELFHQLDEIGFESWSLELIDVVETINALLQQKLQDVDKAITQLERIFKIYRQRSQEGASLWVKLSCFFSFSLLDKNLRKNAMKTEKFLGFRYQTFMHRVRQYDLLHQSTEQSIKKFSHYLIFDYFDSAQKNLFLRLYQAIRIWELNQTTRSLPKYEPVRAIRNLQPADKLLIFFKQYEKNLRLALFNRSRTIKLMPYTLVDLIGKIQHQHALQGQMAELYTLSSTIRKYRDFLLRTDPNPYIRSRLGFGEWIVGPEPAITKRMMELIFEVEELDKLFQQMMKSIEEGDVTTEWLETHKKHIQRTLHEMAQPLASYSLMRTKGEELVHQLQQLNELGSTHASVVDFMGGALSRALRCDWKFHVLHEIPQFEGLFVIHQEILGRMQDRSHLNRIHHFKKLIGQVLKWVKSDNAHKHLDEIEVHTSDLKGYLQDFLAHVQRAVKSLEEKDSYVEALPLRELSSQLLEYRYLFGHFFHHLRRDKAEERVIRNQFLFVDQYFESVENRLNELKKEP